MPWPGERHAVAMKEKKFKEPQIFNPGRLGAHELSQSFCGTCHTSFEQAMLMPGQAGINNIRFQPYRMFNSRGHNTKRSAYRVFGLSQSTREVAKGISL